MVKFHSFHFVSWASLHDLIDWLHWILVFDVASSHTVDTTLIKDYLEFCPKYSLIHYHWQIRLYSPPSHPQRSRLGLGASKKAALSMWVVFNWQKKCWIAIHVPGVSARRERYIWNVKFLRGRATALSPNTVC